MSGNSLFKPPTNFEQRIKELKQQGIEQGNLLLQVELGFALMEKLELDDEPVTVIPAILSGMFIRHPKLDNLTKEKRKVIANCRQIIPFSARFTWLNALQDYIRNIPKNWRNYDFDVKDLDNQIIEASKNLQQQTNYHICQQCLTATLEYRQRESQQVKANTYYQFEAKTKETSVRLQVKFTTEQIKVCHTSPWFKQVKDKSSAITIDWEDLKAEAEFLDRREEILREKYNLPSTAKGNWVKRFEKLNYHRVLSDNLVENQIAQKLVIDGFTHIAGMVASGKSTLSMLLASYIIRNLPDNRITIVVGDTQSAIKIANQINWWFCDDVENDEPVAVSILGRSQRDKHLMAFSHSDDYLAHLERNQSHWGERWLNTVCPLQGRINPSDRIDKLKGKPLQVGSEPCQSLQKAPKEETKKATGKYHLCPFFHRCPSQQMYRDMSKAKVWITTAGGIAQGGMPYHYELRPLKMGELVYLQSDIVIFDEADTIVEWFDKVYAEQVTLTDSSGNGVFDQIARQVAQSRRNESFTSSLTSRWTKAERDSQTVINTIFSLLNQEVGIDILRNWIQQGYFTPHVLFYKLARRLAGLEEYRNPEQKSEQQIKTEDAKTELIIDIFDEFLKDIPKLETNSNKPVIQKLFAIIQKINRNGDSAFDESIYEDCYQWITEFFPDTQTNLDNLKSELNNLRNQPNAENLYITEEENIDSLKTLAYRLQFVLTATLLDRHSKIVFYEWQNRPKNIEEDSPHRQMPRGMLNILPLPMTGRQFGTYYSPQNSNTLSLFAYSNIGRDYVLNFHRLLADLDENTGTNVLALSGTSYLPDSTTFHVGNPQGVLKPEQTAEEAIKQSEFKFIPQFDGDNKPIRLSGKLGNKKQAHNKLTQVAKLLVKSDNNHSLITELETLKHKGEKEPELWENRDRILILVNSYEQAKWVAEELRKNATSISEQVCHLVSDDSEDKPSVGELKRADIETFDYNQGKILVAPTNSIGRGFNILNSHGKAAFGAVYFLTRPYPHPNDTSAIAQELNRRAYQWREKEDFIAWQQGDGIAESSEILRKEANRYWRLVEQRSYYRTLRDEPELCAFPRYDLASTTLGRIIQAVGRLIRGGVPFHGYFVDSAWADNSAKKLAEERIGGDADSIENDNEENSLLVATILRACDYAFEDESVGNALYKPLADALERIEGVFW